MEDADVISVRLYLVSPPLRSQHLISGSLEWKKHTKILRASSSESDMETPQQRIGGSTLKKKMDNAFQLPLKEKELGKRFNCLAVVYDFIICYSFSSPFFVCHIFPVYHEALVSNHKKNPKLCVIVEDYLVEPFMNNLARSIPPYNSGCHNRPEPFPYCRVNWCPFGGQATGTAVKIVETSLCPLVRLGVFS